MSLRLQKFVYGGTTLAPSLPCGPWTPATQAIGAGREVSASGLAAVWVTRWERGLEIPIRFTEAEWPAVRAFLEYAQAGGTFTWFPDKTLVTNYTCELIAPAIGEKLVPARGESRDEYSLSLTLRRTSGAAIDEAYFG